MVSNFEERRAGQFVKSLSHCYDQARARPVLEWRRLMIWVESPIILLTYRQRLLSATKSARVPLFATLLQLFCNFSATSLETGLEVPWNLCVVTGPQNRALTVRFSTTM